MHGGGVCGINFIIIGSAVFIFWVMGIRTSDRTTFCLFVSRFVGIAVSIYRNHLSSTTGILNLVIRAKRTSAPKTVQDVY